MGIGDLDLSGFRSLSSWLVFISPYVGRFKKSSFILLLKSICSLGRDTFGLFLKKERTISGEWAKAIKSKLLFIFFLRSRSFLSWALGIFEKKQITNFGIDR